MLDVATNAAFGPGDFVAGWEGTPVGNARSRALTGLAPGRAHWYRARAANAAGEGPWSERMAADLSRVDRDGDGMPDWAELVAGTEPGDSNSVFRAGGISASGQVAVPSVAGRIYHLQYATDLLQPVWWPVPGATNIPGDGGLLELAPAPSGDIQRTYRIAVEAPSPG